LRSACTDLAPQKEIGNNIINLKKGLSYEYKEELQV
jgi:hypothetical protein